MKLLSFLAVGISIALTACAPARPLPEAVPYLRLSPVYFYNHMFVRDDELEPAIEVSSHPGWSLPANWLAGVPEDVYVRAFIDKRTKVVIYQVVTQLTYFADTWRDYATASYASPNGPQWGEVTKIGQGQVDCGSRVMGCRFTEQIGFGVPESVLRDVADHYDPAGEVTFRFKLKSRSGDQYIGELSAAEVKATLAMVTERRLDVQPAH